LAQDRELLKDATRELARQSRRFRYAHVYPRGPNEALVIAAYQDFVREREIRYYDRERSLRWQRKRLRQWVHRHLQRDALLRNLHVRSRLPAASPRPTVDDQQPLVALALDEVALPFKSEHAKKTRDEDQLELEDGAALRSEISALLRGESHLGPPPGSPEPWRWPWNHLRLERGLRRFSRALIRHAIDRPDLALQLSPQLLHFASMPPPRRLGRPWLTFLLIRLPLQILVVSALLFGIAYGAAYYYVNDAFLAALLTDVIGNEIDGELAFERVHWSQRLIVDLLTGQPHAVEVYGVRVYEPFKRAKSGLRRETASAEHLTASLVLHEIIPFNRLGIPAVFDIPWVLHFSNVVNHTPMWVGAREIIDERTGQSVISLPAAFGPADDTPASPGYKRLTFRVDETKLNDVRVSLDFTAQAGWGVDLKLNEVDLGLLNVGDYPEAVVPEQMPFYYHVNAGAAEGSVHALDRDLELRNVEHLELESGWRHSPLGDLWLETRGELGGAPVHLHGSLLDTFGERPGVDFHIDSPLARSLVEHFAPPDPDTGSALIRIDGAGHLHARGPLDDPEIEMAAQGLTLDLGIEELSPLTNADGRVVLRHEIVPPRWRETLGPSAKAWVFHLRHVDGDFLGGRLNLDTSREDPHFIWPDPGYSFRSSLGLMLEHVDPGLIAEPKSTLATLLAGKTSVRIGIDEVVYGPANEGLAVEAPKTPRPVPGYWPPTQVALRPGDTGNRNLQEQASASVSSSQEELQWLRVTVQEGRYSRASNDHLPREFTYGGGITWSPHEGLDLVGLNFRAPGAELLWQGGFDPEFRRFLPTQVRLDIDDGPAFFSAIDVPVVIPSLNASLAFSGPIAAPHGEAGRFSAPSIEFSKVQVKGLEQSKLWLDKGALHLRTAKVEIFGGNGPLELDLVFGEQQKLLADPKFRADVRLTNLNAKAVAGLPLDIEDSTFALHVGDQAGKPATWAKLVAQGEARIPRLTVAGVPYAAGYSTFVVTPEALTINALNLNYIRALSPTQASNIWAKIGSLAIRGRVGFDSDPTLDLTLSAKGLPLRALTNFVDPTLDLRGRLADGSNLSVRGTLSRPDVSGKLELRGIAFDSFGLGSGRLGFASQESRRSASDPTPVRKIAISGQLDHPDHREASVQLNADIGFASSGKNTSTLQARLDASVAQIPVERLLSRPGDESMSQAIDGYLTGMHVRARYCPGAVAILAECQSPANDERKAPAASDDALQALGVEVTLDHFWLGPSQQNGEKTAETRTGASIECPAKASLCSRSPLHAKLDDNQLELKTPWFLATGAAGSIEETISVEGAFDLSGDNESDKDLSCDPATTFQMRRNDEPAKPRGGARLRGAINIEGIAALLEPMGVSRPRGTLEADVEISGALSNPSIRGVAELRDANGPLSWSFAAGGVTASELDLALPKLKVQLRDHFAEIDGELKLAGESIRFGANPQPSAIAFSGECRGQYQVSTLSPSSFDAKILQQTFPEAITRARGAFGIESLAAAGHLDPQPSQRFFESLRARIELAQRATHLTVDTYELRLTSGTVEVRRCTDGEPCFQTRRGYGIFFGGEQGAGSTSRPRQPMRASVAGRAESGVEVWGRLFVDDDFSELSQAEIRAALNMFPFRDDDNSGQPELSAALNSDGLTFTIATDGSKRLSGDLLVERARWLRDITQGISVLSFADPNPAPPTSWPRELAEIELDLSMRTNSPFRIDNNVLHGLEAQAQLHLGGTLEEFELTGRIDVSRGLLDLALLGGAYSIERGRVNLDREFDRSTVELLATRKELVRVDNELHRVSLALSGSLAAIQWRCSSTATRGRNLSTAGGCIDYLIFDTGNAALAQQEDASRNPALPRLSRPLTLVGNLTQKELNEYVQARAPQIEEFLPKMRVRIGQLGVEAQANTRPEWLAWRWGSLTFGVNYLRGYPSGLLRNSQSFSLRLNALENLAIEYNKGNRNYTNRAFILDPPNFDALEFIHTFRIPSVR
jgi:hypothetical protein